MHSTTTRSFPLALPLALAIATLTACADGGKVETPQSEVKVQSTHHIFGFRSLRGFGTGAVSPDAVNTDRATLDLFNDSNYRVTRSSGTSASLPYALETTGALSLFSPGSGQEPSVVFGGGCSYGPAPVALAASDLFFTDRVSTPLSQSLGLYVGTRVVTGEVELAGKWHLLSLHAILEQTIAVPENIGRAAHGSIDITTGAPGTSRTISGTGSQSDSVQDPSNITFGGTIQNLLISGSGDGTCNLTLNYGTDARTMLAVATGNSTAGRLVLGLDAEEGDGETGLAVMVRKFDPPTTPVEPEDVPGRFLVGGHTLFVKHGNSGSDAFLGVITLSTPDGFRLDAVGNQGIDFTYTGTWQLNRTAGPGTEDGGITITVNGTNETWFAAIDRTYQTLVFVDPYVEPRSNQLSELNIGFGVRERTPPP